jgi:DivIVA domain-containing protein
MRDYPQRVDRDSIERRDFPVGRRGYDQEAVDAHLRRIADEFEALRGRSPAARATPLAAGASEQVRLILEAAEASAAELRADAGREAGDHVAKVKDAAGGMISRLDDLERELGGLLEALRQSGERLNEGLAKLQRQASDLSGAAAEAEPEPVAGNGSPGDDEAGARLIALNMALSGKSREETSAYLAEHFTLTDAEALLDDVYDRADG